MKKMKKALLLALSLAMSATLFAACGKDKGNGGTTSSTTSSSVESEPVSSETSEPSESESSTVESESSTVESEPVSSEISEPSEDKSESSEVSEKEESVNVVKETVTGATIEGADTAIVGQDYYFSVEFATGYEAGEAFAVTVDGEDAEYDEATGQYVVRNVAYGFMIEVTGVVEVSYAIDFTCDIEGAVLNEDTTMKGTATEYVFRISLADKYSQSADTLEVYYTANGGAETLVTANGNGEYVIANQKADITVIVKNVALNKFDVHFAYNDEVKYTAEGVTVGTEVSAEALAAAKDAVTAGVEGTFVGWDTALGLVEGEVTLNAVIAEGETEAVATPFAAAVATENAAPAGYTSVSKETATWNEEKASANDESTKTVYADIANVDVEQYKELYFQMKVEKTWILFDGWSHALINKDSERDGTIAVWELITLKKNGTGWDVTFCGTTTFRQGHSLKGLLTFEYDVRSAELGFADCTPAEISVTEIIAVKDENYVHGTRETVVDQLFVNSTLTEEEAPYGYENVYHEAAVWDESKKGNGGDNTVIADLATVNVAKYKTINFQIKVDKSWVLFDGWGHYFAGSGQWTPVTMTKTETGWDIEFVGGAGTKTTRAGNNLAALLAMEFDARSAETGREDCVPAEIWVTELIGVLDENYVEPVSAVTVADSAFLDTTADTTVSAPMGYTKVSTRTSFRGSGGAANEDGSVNIAPNTFSRADLSGYREVSFMTYTKESYYIINDTWVQDIDGWVEWKMVKISDGWNVTITASNGTVWYGGTLKGTTAAALFGASSAEISGGLGIYTSANGQQVWVTEMIGIPSSDAPAVQLKGEKIAESAYLAGVDIGGSQFVLDTDTDAAEGFENVYKYQSSTAANIHGMNYDGTNLDDCSKVYFALKTAKYNCNGEKTLEGGDWLYFELTQTAENTWDITITCNGETVYSGTAFNGAYNSEANPAYSDNAIDAILYGNPSGFYPMAVDGDLTVYVSEVRVEKKA